VSQLRSILLAVLCIGCCQHHVWAQTSGTSTGLDALAPKGIGAASVGAQSSDNIVISDVVEPSLYYVGPGDVLGLQTTGIDFVEKTLVVSPENTIMIERLGLVNAKGLTLDETKQKIAELVTKRNPNTTAFVTLRKCRQVHVTIRGNVAYPGTYSVSASLRVGTLLEIAMQPWLLRKDAILAEQYRMNSPLQQMDFSQNSTPVVDMYTQRFSVVCNSGVNAPVDIPKSRLAGFEHLNPHVKENDVIVIPTPPAAYPTTSIGGAVYEPLTMPYKAGDVAAMLIAASGGIRTDIGTPRFTIVQPQEQPVTIEQSSSSMPAGIDVVLRPGSVIVAALAEVTAGPAQAVVEVSGDVAKPGAYVVQDGVTTIAQLLEMAGGATTTASLELAYVVRPESKTTQRQHRELADRSFMYSDLKLEDTTRFHLDQRLRVPIVSANVANAVKNPKSMDNAILYSGDILVVPTKPTRVYVYGQLQHPGYVEFSPGKTIDWYIQRAGGVAAGGRRDRARIVKGKSKIWIDSDESIVEPGDEVYIPRNPDVPAGYEIQTYAVIAGIAGTIVGITATVISLLSR
jgi:polysaccharide biosynthesis/export protein